MPDERIGEILAAGRMEKLAGGNQGVVYRIEDGARQYIVKQPMGWLLTRKVRLAMLRREREAYRRLAGIPGIPQCHGLFGGDKLVIEFVHGRTLRAARPGPDERDAFFGRLRRLIGDMHAAGVAHADLKRRDNILVADDGSPWLIDFGAAVFLGDRPGRLRRRIFAQFCRMDLNAWIKLKYRRRYDEIAPEDLGDYRPTIVERVATVVLRIWRRITGRQWRKARRRARKRGS